MRQSVGWGEMPPETRSDQGELSSSQGTEPSGRLLPQDSRAHCGTCMCQGAALHWAQELHCSACTHPEVHVLRGTREQQ